MNMLRIRDLFTIKKGKKMKVVSCPAHSQRAIRYLQIDDLRDDKNIKYCEMAENGVVANHNDIVIAWDGANAGTSAYGLEGAVGSTLALLTPKRKDLYTPYAGRCLQFRRRHLRETCTGATIPHINKRFLEEMLLPLPPLKTQREIADALDKAQELIDKRKRQIEMLDEFLRSVFLDMFFGICTGQKKPLSHLCVINPSKGEVKDLQDDLEVTFLPMSAVSENGDIVSAEVRRLDEVRSGFTYFREGDVLFAKITPCMENGKGAIATGLSHGIGFGSTEFHVLRPKENIMSSWLYHLTATKSFRRLAEANMTGSAGQKRVPRGFLDRFRVMVPPLEVQQRFDGLAQEVQSEKRLMEQGLVQMQNNFNSIMQRAFRGGLFS